MVKLVDLLRPPRGFAFCKFAYSPGLIEDIKQYPGTRWDAVNKQWVIPIELQGAVLKSAQSRGITPSFVFPDVPLHTSARLALNAKLFAEYQVPAIQQIWRNGVGLVCHETGLGKSATAIEACRAGGSRHVLVVTQRGVVGAWGDEFDKWWPGSAWSAGARVVSYGQLDDVISDDSKAFDAVILDEIQNVKNWKTDRYKNVKRILKELTIPDALIIGLSATPIDKPEEIYAIMELLRPGGFGWWPKFRDRYCLTETNVFGGREVTRVKGLNPAHQEELKARIHAFSSFASKCDFAHLLPAFTVRNRRVKSGEKSELAKEWVEEKVDAGEKKLCVVTYSVALAEKIARELNTPFLVTGKVGERDDVIKQARKTPECILVASMKSIGVGIDLTEFPSALVTELYWSINVMKQLLGRFSRLSGKVPSAVDLLVMGGTADEMVASRLVRKIDAINMIMARGQTDQQITDALNEEEDEATFQQELRLAFADFKGWDE